MSSPVYQLADLLTQQNLDAIVAQYLAGLQGAGFPAITEWQPKAGVEMSFVSMVGSSLADLVAADLPLIIAGGFLGKGQGQWLDVLSESVYLRARRAATFTTFNYTLTCAPTAGPYVLNPGDVSAVAASGNHYVSTTGGTLAPGGSLTVAMQAAAAGGSYADDPAGVGFTLGTALAGVTAAPASPTFSSVKHTGSSSGQISPTGTGPTGGLYAVRIEATGDIGSARISVSVDGGAYIGKGTLQASTPIGNGITLNVTNGSVSGQSFQYGDVFTFTVPGGSGYVQGSDAESDSALAARCRACYQALSLNPTPGLIALWVSFAAPQASRILIGVDPVVPGRMLVTAADSHGGLDPSILAAITAYIAPKLSGLEGILCVSAEAQQIAPEGLVTVTPSSIAAVQAAAQLAWLQYAGQTPIGGRLLSSKLEDIIMDAGAIDASQIAISGASPYFQLDANAVPAPESVVSSLTWVFA